MFSIIRILAAAASILGLFCLPCLASDIGSAPGVSLVASAYCPSPFQFNSPPPSDLHTFLRETDGENWQEKKKTEAPPKIDAIEDIATLKLRRKGAVKPYIGGGITFLESPNGDPDYQNADVLAYRFGAGFGCDLDERTRLNIGYRFQLAPEMLPEGDELLDLDEIHQLSFGIQAQF